MTEKELLVIVPSRDRPHKVTEFIDCWRETTSGNSEILFCLDEDNAHKYDIPNDVSLIVRPRMRLGAWLNYASTQYVSNNPIKYIGSMGDDHLPRTKNWDMLVVEPLNDTLGVSYGNDLLHFQNLPTAAFMNKEIVDTLGYFCPPEAIHLYLDNYWKALGLGLRSLHYCPDVIIEHKHYTNGKAEKDAIYEEVNSDAMYAHDRAAVNNYLHTRFLNDLEKLKA